MSSREKAVRKLETSGDIPKARFGHTANLVDKNRVVLFGGATGDAGNYRITNDTYQLQLDTLKWTFLDTTQLPTARAAHAAACVESNQLVVYGGATGGGQLSSDELYLLDLEQSVWMAVPVQGITPGRRYGHSMIFFKPYLILFGGNTGSKTENDVWTLNAELSPFSWSQVNVNGPKPPSPRVYHSADVCETGPAGGMMVVFGGRTIDSKSLKDAWGLRKHRDGRYDWVEAPYKGRSTEPRFQHSCIFYQTKLFVIGGRGADVSVPLPTSVYNTETCDWKVTESINSFRHSCWLVGSKLYCYGGFDHRSPSAPTGTLQVMDLELADRQATGGSASPIADSAAGTSLRSSHSPNTLRGSSKSSDHRGMATSSRSLANAEIKISKEVFVSMERDFTQKVRRINIDSLEDESKKISHGDRGATAPRASQNDRGQSIAKLVIDRLCLPGAWEPKVTDHEDFFMQTPDIHVLCEEVQFLLKQEDMVLHLRAPIKVYGDIHGQFGDLMRLFHRYKAPTDQEGGDIDSMDYLFLGDYVDRGSHSLETMCLLFALKIKYPTQIHLLRGNHEDPAINSMYGFKDECQRRLRIDQDDPKSAWARFNQAFEWLPCGALIEERILCIHGGLGSTIDSVRDIENMRRPLQVSQVPQNAYEQAVTDLLWSDPTDNDAMTGVSQNETRDPDGSGRIFKFGPDRVKNFLDKNPPLSLIIRAHECVMDGFERFAGGKLITVFSATDYCGHHKNAGALLFVRRDLTVVPKLIYPVDRGNQNAWDASITQQRPPTPPRNVPRARRTNDHSGGEW
eukprot:GEMP01001962.1.p1 GENE.GEMP01001962.1~~GEMP01001962.1.p1  ORF type:complete len:795 (+),score=125.88 GEMP01001962.1:297-2681(+)